MSKLIRAGIFTASTGSLGLAMWLISKSLSAPVWPGVGEFGFGLMFLGAAVFGYLVALP